jgi:hypothetical protein
MFNNPEKFGIKTISSDWAKTMHMYSRYGDERPDLTFEYGDTTPWGKPFTNDQIVDNYLELQGRLKSAGLCSLQAEPVSECK